VGYFISSGFDGSIEISQTFRLQLSFCAATLSRSFQLAVASLDCGLDSDRFLSISRPDPRLLEHLNHPSAQELKKMERNNRQRHPTGNRRRIENSTGGGI